MLEVLEIEQKEKEITHEKEPKFDSWIIEIPKEIIESQGLEKDTLATLTIVNGEIEGEIISPSSALKDITKRILGKNRKVYEELKKLGD